MPTGILLLDKPAGLSSNAALQQVRRAYGARKAGHVGSLDPLATGMLPICLDEATKVAGDLVEGDKCYCFEVTLGRRTATGDAEGEIVEERPVPLLGRERLDAVLAAFLGTRKQTPPMYSALKHGGRPLYRLARAGVEVERTPRTVRITRLDLKEHTPTRLVLELVCSKGTYVRTLAEEISAALGTCGHVSRLRRLYVEPFVQAEMASLERVREGGDGGELPALLPPDAALSHLPAARFDAQETDRLRHGQQLQARALPREGRCRMYDERGRFFGIGDCAGGIVQPRRVLQLPVS